MVIALPLARRSADDLEILPSRLRSLRRRRVAPAASADPLIDRHGRTVDHVRLAVTSACDLRCLYCRPCAAASRRPVYLTDRQRLELVRFLHQRYGVKTLRLTGGEPLLHPTIVQLIASLRNLLPTLSLAMTTNASRLESLAADLRRAGLGRLNISLDTIEPKTYRALTGGDLTPVIRAIDRVLSVGFPPPRINTVVLAGINDGQLLDLVGWAFERGIEIRFLEAMPIGPAAAFNRAHFMSAAEVRRHLSSVLRLDPLPIQDGETAKRYAAVGPGCMGTLGIIAPVTEPFCAQCRRMRITADGRLFPCLLNRASVRLLPCWEGGCFDAAQADGLVRGAIAAKKASGSPGQDTAMMILGG